VRTVLHLSSAMGFAPERRVSPLSLAAEPEIDEVKPQDIVERCRVIAMLKKWAKCSCAALNEGMLATSPNYSQSYPQKLWSEQYLYPAGSVSSDMRLFVSAPLVWWKSTGALAHCSLLFLFSPSRAMADFTGQVVSVLDGDTRDVLHKHHPERICLSGIDCPEKGHAYGNRAKQAAVGCGIKKGRPDQGDPSFTSLWQWALPQAPQPEANQP